MLKFFCILPCPYYQLNQTAIKQETRNYDREQINTIKSVKFYLNINLNGIVSRHLEYSFAVFKPEVSN